MQAALSGNSPFLAGGALWHESRHNGTVQRWNRPIQDTVDGTPHLRVENRVLPARPTVLDTLANTASYYGALRTLVDADRPVWTQMLHRCTGLVHGNTPVHTWPVVAVTG